METSALDKVLRRAGTLMDFPMLRRPRHTLPEARICNTSVGDQLDCRLSRVSRVRAALTTD